MSENKGHLQRMVAHRMTMINSELRHLERRKEQYIAEMDNIEQERAALIEELEELTPHAPAQAENTNNERGLNNGNKRNES